MAGITPPMMHLPSPVPTEAGQRNMALLIQLRWLAVGGQLLTIAVVQWLLGVPLPLLPLLAAVATLVALNLFSVPLLRRRQSVSEAELFAALLFDVAALGWQLHFTGGFANPFVSLFLLQVVIGAVLLRQAASWGLVAATLLVIAALTIAPVPLALPPRFADDPMRLYLFGSAICFVLIAVLLVAFVTRIARNLAQRDAALATIRQRAAEEDHIVRMGLLASGAAHELGTPLATMSVLVNDWRASPTLADEIELHDDLDDMDAAIRRCKTIVSGILMSAGEARGEAPARTTMRTFLNGIVAEWRSARGLARLDYRDNFGDDIAIISDPALRQVIGNVIDNAIEVSPDHVEINARREADALVIRIDDRGPGFAPEILDGFGRPYRSTKDRPGAGLGLFLLVNVMRKLGGEALAENPPGGGARVTVRLPLSAIALASGAPR